MSGFEFASGNRRLAIAFENGVVISRQDLDWNLVKNAQEAGAEFQDQRIARVVSKGNNRWLVALRDHGEETTLSARCVVLASGLRTKVPQVLTRVLGQRITEKHSRIGAGAILENGRGELEPGIIYMARGNGGYVGAVKLPDGRIDVAGALDPEAVKSSRGLANTAEKIWLEAGFASLPSWFESDWKGTPVLSSRYQRVSGKGIFLIGDAAGYVEPFTGEGIAWGLKTGWDVAPYIKATLDGDMRACDAWNIEYRSIVGSRQRTCRVVSKILRSKILTESLLGLVSLWSSMAETVINKFNGRTLTA